MDNSNTARFRNLWRFVAPTIDAEAETLEPLALAIADHHPDTTQPGGRLYVVTLEGFARHIPTGARVDVTCYTFEPTEMAAFRTAIQMAAGTLPRDIFGPCSPADRPTVEIVEIEDAPAWPEILETLARSAAEAGIPYSAPGAPDEPIDPTATKH